MKVRVVSDLHLEFLNDRGRNDFAERLNASPKVDVLVLAGDVALAIKPNIYINFIKTLAATHDYIFWIMGNHEYYKGNYQKCPEKIRDSISSMKNVKLLNNQSFDIDHVTFHGSTLWTNFENGNPISKMECDFHMNDSRYIRTGAQYRRMRSSDFALEHQKSKNWLFKSIEEATEKGQTNFVVTHHGPSRQSIHTRFRTGPWAKLNGGYVSDLEEEILGHDISYWVHGHVHDSFMYEVGSTIVYVNPYGYEGENPLFTFDHHLEI